MVKESQIVRLHPSAVTVLKLTCFHIILHALFLFYMCNYDHSHITCQFLLLRSSLHTPYTCTCIRPRALFMHRRNQVFYLPEQVTCTLEGNANWRKYYNHCTGKEYPMKDETKQIEIQAHICQTSSIIAERFSVSRCYISPHMHKPYNVLDYIVFRKRFFW